MEKIEEIVNKILSKMWISQNPVLHAISDFVYNMTCFAYKIMYYPSRKEFLRAIKLFGSKEDKADVKKCLRSMRREWMRYGVAPKRYFTYDFPHLTKKEKKNFITDLETSKYSAILSDWTDKKIFAHKYETYLQFQKYYKRDIVKSSNLDESFLAKHPRFFFKPEHSLKGLGCRIISAEDYPDIQAMKDAIPDWDDGICEELIAQDDFENAFHPESLNTVRTQTLMMRDGTVRIIGAYQRMGRGNSITDNVSGGGMIANIDISRGVINTDAVDDGRRTYTVHPDTGAVIKGAVLPQWEELCQIITDVAKTVPTVRYISLDMALSKNGWVIVEGNADGNFMQQVCTHKGCKKEFDQLIRA